MTDLVSASPDCIGIHGGIVAVLERAHRATARSVSMMAATGRDTGRRMIEFQQGGHPYLNHTREHWMKTGGDKPDGLTLRVERGASDGYYTLEGLAKNVAAAGSQSVLPSESQLPEDLAKKRRDVEAQHIGRVSDAGDET